ncbi:MAG: protein translocase subunit SecD [Nitriliruptoraceae bacterium]
MEKRPLLVSLGVIVALMVIAIGAILLGARPELGLDLQGGISAVYSPQLPQGQEIPEDFDEILDETIEVIRARVDSLGVAEPQISRQGNDILVQLPGVGEPDRLRELIGTTARLTFRPVLAVISPEQADYDDTPACDLPFDERVELADGDTGILCEAPDALTGSSEVLKYVVGPVGATGEQITDAYVQIGGGFQAFQVGLDFDNDGAARFAQLTADLACARDAGEPGLLAIVLDGEVAQASSMAPEVACGAGIRGGSASITTGTGLDRAGQEAEAADLAVLLRAGSLPLTLEASTFQTVSPTLGGEALRAGLLAGLVGVALVAIWLIGFYGVVGLVTVLSVTLFGVFAFAIVSALGALGFALTLAGVAGLIVSVGITADSGIIFAERIRDEIRLGKTVRSAVVYAFRSAWKTNLTGNTVTLVAAAILYWLAVGPVRGFALMLGIANIIDLAVMYLFARPAVFLLAQRGAITRRGIRAAATTVGEQS